jgi:endonuclease I
MKKGSNKHMKKILWIATILLSIVTLMGCEETRELPTHSAQEIINALEIEYQEGDSKDSVTGSMVFPLTSSLDQKIKISWMSDQPSIIDNFGTVNRPDVDTLVNVSYTVDNYGTKFSGLITFNVLAEEDDEPIEVIKSYTINYYFENIYDEEFTLVESESYEGVVGAYVYINPEREDGFDISNEQSVTTGTVKEDGSTELSIYYLRKTYTVTLYDGVDILDTMTVKHGHVLSLEDPLKEDYIFLEWLVYQTTQKFDFSTPITSDLKLSAVFKALDDDYTYEGYYAGADGLEGQNLVLFLNELLNNTYQGVDYGDARYMLDDTDKDPNQPGNLILVYLGTSVSGAWDFGNTWNREHVWPQSFLGVSADNSTVNAASDLHNLKPSDPSENSSRSNKYYGNTTNSQTYEPRDAVKGDIARILFYMDVMYDELSLISANEGNTYEMGNLDILLEWHVLDPVDDFEIYRNDMIYGYQYNRNPFIDHPEFVDKVYGSTSSVSMIDVSKVFGSMIETIYIV